MQARIALALILVASLQAAIDAPVKLDTGQVSGIPGNNPDIRVFKGIPFAAPPVGNLRWHSPTPAAKWDGVRKGDEFGPMCMQAPGRGGAAQKMSEDCLYLNVWTAAKSPSAKRPVIVWIHPGGYTSGSGASPGTDGEALAKKGVIVVTINYRLGPLGFFAHPELTKESPHRSSGNYGLLDQIAALQWVRDNIAKFGGDPSRVTVFGESAGAIDAGMLMCSPLAGGLFARVIMESGPVLEASVGRQIVSVSAGLGVVVGLAFRNRVPPRKPLTAQPAPRRLLPLRFRRQPIPIHSPVGIHRRASVPIREHLREPCIRVIHRLQIRLV